MLKNEKGVTLTVLIITIAVMLIIAGATITTSELILRDARIKTAITGMYLAKAKASAIYSDWEFNKHLSNLPGSHISVDKLARFGVTPEGDTKIDDFWYEWTQDDIRELGLDETLLKDGAEYFVNYVSEEIIYTPGVKDSDGNMVYTLSEMLEL